MGGDELLVALKQKQQPVFGTVQEKRDRLKKFHGIESSEMVSLASGAS